MDNLEKRFIISILNEDKEGLSSISINKLNFQKIITFASCHKLIGHFYHIFVKLSICSSIHDKWLEIFKFYYFGTEKKNKIYKNEYSSIVNNVEGLSGIKGIFLISDIYVNLGQRPINDIDFLLVNPLNYVDDITNNLIKNGYVQGYELNNNIIKFSREEVLFKYLTHSTICPFVKYVDGYFVKVDINLYLKGALKRCTNYNIVNIQVLILLTEIYFNQTNLHSIKYSKDIELIKYVDLHYIFQKYSSRDYECLLNSIENNNLLVESRLILGCYLQIFENKLLKETILKRKKWDINSEQELVKFGNDLVFMWNEAFYERCFDTERYKKVSEEKYRLLDNYESTFNSFKEKEKK